MLDAAQHGSGFPLVEIGAVVDVVRTTNPAVTTPDDEFIYVDLSAVDQDTKAITAPHRLLGSDAPSRARQVLKRGDVLVSTVRPNLNGVAIVSPDIDGAIGSTGFCVLRPAEDRLDSRYLYHWVRTPAFVQDMVRQATGASYPAVTDGTVRRSRIPAPALGEQRRIAAILDEADALRAKRRAALAQLDNMAQAIFVKMFGEPHCNSRALPTTTVGSLCERLTVGHVGPMSDEYVANGIPMLRSLNVRRGEISLTDMKFITPAFHKTLGKSKLTPGDVVTVRTGRPGTTAVVPETLQIANCADLIVMTCGPRILPAYLAEALNQMLGDADHIQGTVGAIQSHFNIGAMRRLVVPIPPLPDQHAFTEAIASVKQASATTHRHSQEIDSLFAALQHRAFRGEL